MPTFGPVKMDVLIKCLRRCGFDGPYSSGKHSFMVKEGVTLTIPNPHHRDIGKEFLTRILKQAQISKEEWERL